MEKMQREVWHGCPSEIRVAGLDLIFPRTPNFQGVLSPDEAAALPKPESAIREALGHPIAASPLIELAKGKKDAVIVISDITQPVSNAVILPPILAQLEEAGIPLEKITTSLSLPPGLFHRQGR